MESINLCVGLALRAEIKSNKNGNGLINFLDKYNLKIANTFFGKTQNMRLMLRSSDGLTKNEIDRLLTDKLHFVKGIQIISRFQFSSDHKPVLYVLKPVSPHARNKNVNQDQTFKTYVPLHKRWEAADLLSQILGKTNWDDINPENIQARYNSLIEAIRITFDELGTPKYAIKTDDKLSENIKTS